eukprot:TRINITY_DN8191_c0_g1_i7.p2 TRINITY_DN8191_c0_g1~~TRINITY_DN8191_c0_g1_i7.p2  ORF type:complete len:124 (-),score=17.19 TRINITY_DN8191_c0_g1_i7:189-560(-)
MGSQQSKVLKEGQALLASLRFLRRVRDERLGDIVLMEEPIKREVVAVVEHSFEDSAQFELELRDLSAKSDQNGHPGLLKVLGLASSSSDALCGSAMRAISSRTTVMVPAQYTTATTTNFTANS